MFICYQYQQLKALYRKIIYNSGKPLVFPYLLGVLSLNIVSIGFFQSLASPLLKSWCFDAANFSQFSNRLLNRSSSVPADLLHPLRMVEGVFVKQASPGTASKVPNAEDTAGKSSVADNGGHGTI